MFTPLAVAGSLVVYTGEEVELVQRGLACRNSKLVGQLPLCGTLDTHDRSWQVSAALSRDAKGVRAAGVRPHFYAQRCPSASKILRF